MGLFSRNRSTAKTQENTTVMAVMLDGPETVAIVGEASYQPAIRAVCGKRVGQAAHHQCVAALVPEPTNKYDAHAIRIDIEGSTVGYLSRGDALDYGPAVGRFAAQRKVIACEALIAGRGDAGETPNLGVFLTLPGPDEALREAED